MRDHHRYDTSAITSGLRALSVALGTIVLILTAVPIPASAQPVEIPRHREAFSLDTGVHDGLSRSVGAETIVAYRGVIGTSGSADAPWVRVHFGDYRLGERSFVLLRSREDGEWQRLDATHMGYWSGSSARFAGGTLDLELHVAPGDEGVFVEVVELTVGEWVGGEVSRDVCGDDDRVASSDPAVARVDTGCTGWMISSGSLLTAGHCGNIAFIEFNVPASNCNGTANPASTNDQYPIDPASVQLVDGPDNHGDDWGIFRCFPNSNTNLLPSEAQNAFYRISKDYENPASIRITGFGQDDEPPGCTGSFNSSSVTQQTSVDDFLNESGSGSNVSLHYKTDTDGGSSGSPVIIMDSPRLAIGIHTTGGCDLIFENGNFGTSFEADNLESAINDHPDPLAVYVDNGHPITSGFSGSVMRPYNRVDAAVGTVPSGGVLSIVTGEYDESVVISTPMEIAVPVGPVVIGSSVARTTAQAGVATEE